MNTRRLIGALFYGGTCQAERVRVAEDFQIPSQMVDEYLAGDATTNTAAMAENLLAVVRQHHPELLAAEGVDRAEVAPMRAVLVIDGTWLLHRMLALHGNRTVFPLPPPPAGPSGP